MNSNACAGDDFWRLLFAPNSVAMVGASDVPGSWGFNITQRLVQSKNRRIYPVNPSHPTIQGMTAYKTVTDIPDQIDLAIIAVPAARVPRVMSDCVAKSIKAAVVISGGFSETGEEGRALEREVVEIARRGGIRFIGPNTMGHANPCADFSILGFMAKLLPGPVGFASQSGNMGSRIMHLTMSQGIGFSKFVCTGNEATLRLEDYLEFMARDEDTRAIAFYIEGLREARRFLSLARSVTPRKPIVVMKSGSTGGARAAARSHTGALAGSDAIYSAAFKQAGVIRAETEDEVADVLAALVKQPLPRGDRVAILTMGGGFGVVAAESCEKEGLRMATLSEKTMSTLDGMLPARWPHGNPVDLAGMDTLGESVVLNCLQALIEDEGVDALISLVGLNRTAAMLPPGMRVQDKSAETAAQRLRTLGERAFKLGKPVLSVGAGLTQGTDKMEQGQVDTFTMYPGPQRAARVLHHLLAYRRYLQQISLED